MNTHLIFIVFNEPIIHNCKFIAIYKVEIDIYINTYNDNGINYNNLDFNVRFVYKKRITLT